MMMKTKMMIITTMLAVSFAYTSVGKTGTNISSDQPVELRSADNVAIIAPVTPKEAMFEEGIVGYETSDELQSFAPVTPREADFSDEAPVTQERLFPVGPIVPSEATFDEDSNCSTNCNGDYLNMISPSAPAEADFDDNSANS
jgi:hypothetical protein